MLAERRDSVAAVIVEPMLQGAGGMIVWPSEFLSGVRQLCDRYDTLMIADEILTGFGRTGRMFACEHASVSPDLICLSKALTGGYLPLAVTAVTERDLRSLSQRRPHESILSRALLHGEPAGLRCRAGKPVSVSNGGNPRARSGVWKSSFANVSSPFAVSDRGDVRGIGGIAAMVLRWRLQRL